MDVLNIPNNEYVVKVKLLAFRENVGGYFTYVFEKLTFENELDRYIMCTRFPNWDVPTININDIGFLKCRYVIAGKDSWFNGNDYTPYKCTDIHFLNFVPEVKYPDLLC